MAFFTGGETVGVAQAAAVTELATRAGSRVVVPRRVIAFARSGHSGQGTSLCRLEIISYFQLLRFKRLQFLNYEFRSVRRSELCSRLEMGIGCRCHRIRPTRTGSIRRIPYRRTT